MINNQASLNDQFNQWMVVDETTGALGIMYYDSVGGSQPQEGRRLVPVLLRRRRHLDAGGQGDLGADRRDRLRQRFGQPVRRLQQPLRDRRPVLPLLDRPPQQWPRRDLDREGHRHPLHAAGSAGDRHRHRQRAESDPGHLGQRRARRRLVQRLPGGRHLRRARRLRPHRARRRRLALHRRHGLRRPHLRLPGHRPRRRRRLRIRALRLRPGHGDRHLRAPSDLRRPHQRRQPVDRDLRPQPRLDRGDGRLRRTGDLQRLPLDDDRLHAGAPRTAWPPASPAPATATPRCRWPAAPPTSTSCGPWIPRMAARRGTPFSAAPRPPDLAVAPARRATYCSRMDSKAASCPARGAASPRSS